MSTGQTVVKYGAVTLSNCTHRLEQQEMTDPTGTQLKCWRFLVHVTGYVHGRTSWCSYSSPNVASSDNGDAAKAHRAVRYRLSPRETLNLLVGCSDTSGTGGTSLLYAESVPSGVTPATIGSDRDDPLYAGAGPTPQVSGLSYYDVNDGPHCRQFDITHVASNEVFRVQAVFEVWLVECDSSGKASGNTNGVLSHRWACIDDIDVNRRTTRTYTGTLELATSQFSPHWFRSLVMPPLCEGMRRESMRFAATEDGRRLQYHISDMEIAIAAPKPATRWSITHTEGARFGQHGFGQIAISLEGDSNVDKGQLIAIADKVIAAKLWSDKDGNPLADGAYIIEDIAFTDHIGDTMAITANASVRRIAVNTANFAAIGRQTFGVPIRQIDLPDAAPGDPDYDPRLSLDAREGETPQYKGPVDLIGIFRCYLQSPCNTTHALNATTSNLGTDENGSVSATPVSEIDAVIVPDLDVEDVPYYSASHSEKMYRVYRMESVYGKKMMRAVMPVAGTSSSSAPTAKIITLSQPQTRRRVRVVAERIGDWPELPDPETLETADMKLLDVKRLFPTVDYTANGQKIYRARMECLFALTNNPAATEALAVGYQPWTNEGFEETTEVATNSTWS